MPYFLSVLVFQLSVNSSALCFANVLCTCVYVFFLLFHLIHRIHVFFLSFLACVLKDRLLCFYCFSFSFPVFRSFILSLSDLVHFSAIYLFDYVSSVLATFFSRVFLVTASLPTFLCVFYLEKCLLTSHFSCVVTCFPCFLFFVFSCFLFLSSLSFQDLCVS